MVRELLDCSCWVGRKGVLLNEAILTCNSVEDNVAFWVESNCIGGRVGTGSKNSSTAFLECSKSIVFLLAIGIFLTEYPLECSESVCTIRADDPGFFLGKVLSG